MRRRSASAACAAFLVICAAGPAGAGVGDVFGMGAEVMSMAGSGSALVTGPWAAHHAPAGLAFAQANRLSTGVVAIGSKLEIRGIHTPIEDPVGFLAGYSFVRKLPGRVFTSIGFGIAAYLLPDTLGHVIQRTPETPYFIVYDNRTQRDMFVPALAVGLGNVLSLGLSLDVLAGLEGPITVRQGQAGEAESSLFLDVISTLRPTPSIEVRPGAGLSFALTYHPAFHVPYSLDVDAEVSGLDIEMHVKARALYTPHTLVLGMGWTLPRVRFALDISWAMWSRLGSPFVEVETRMLEVGLLVPSNPEVQTRDTLGVRLGIEGKVLSTPSADLFLRGGYGYESPVVGPQSGRSNVMDGHKVTVAAGLGAAWKTGIQGFPRVLVDLHAGAVWVSRLTHIKKVHSPGEGRDDPTLIVDEDESTPGTQISNPGYPDISGSGWVLTTAFTLTLEMR
ncbi:MAG: hypothetical protein JRG91_07505 [Deltaproteobacteria bacterium]|nr:hypothetical protein [Deltaproteobacteria bacterium]